MTFDETNAKILALLQHDSSLTNEAIGREVNLWHRQLDGV